jgi:hypothetical protein
MMTKGSSTPQPVAPEAPSAKPGQAAPQKPVIFTLQAVQETWLKLSTDPAAELPDNQKVLVPARYLLPVVGTTEIQGNAHELVELDSGGEWHVFMPHFRRIQVAGPEVPPPPPVILQPGAVDWHQFNALITPNLTVGEVLQFDPRRRPAAQSSVIPRILGTCLEFQAIRNAWARPLGVTSFYRPEPINREVGGVRNSFHVSGLAMDLYPVGLPLQALYDYLITRWTGGFGDGRGRGFIHLDRRDGGRFVPGGGVRPAAIWPY